MTEPGDDWLWDRSGEPDPLDRRLENALAPLRLDARLGELPGRGSTVRRGPWGARATGGALALAAGALLWLAASSPRTTRIARDDARRAADLAAGVASELVAHVAPCRSEPTPGAEELRYEALEGTPRCGGLAAPRAGYVDRGGWLETPPGSRVRILLGTVGQVTLAPGSRLRVLAAEPGEQRLELERGRLSAQVTAPPRLFLVRTKHATAVDLGCAYDLEVAPSGLGTLRVRSGAVELAPPPGSPSAVLPIHVPAGAEAAIGPVGPGTPIWSARPAGVRDALRRWDSDPRDAASLDLALAGLGEHDTLTLLQLLARAPRARREGIVSRLEPLAPGAAPRESLLDATPAALLAIRDALSPRWQSPGEPAGPAPIPSTPHGTGQR